MIQIREATPADNAALCALESRTPLLSKDGVLYFDRTDFFAVHALQDRGVIMLAEEIGEVLGVCAGGLQEVPVAGETRLLLYIHGERIDPARQRQGLGGQLTSAIAAHWREQGVETAASYWFISSGNAPSLSFASRSGKPWPDPVYPCGIETKTSAGRPPPKRIGAAPIVDIVRLLNATHAGKELFRPYTEVALGQRLSMSRDYGWGDIYGRYVDGRLVAVAGVWDRARTLTMRWRSTEGVEQRERAWYVADYGFEPGAEAELAALLSDIAGLAATRNVDTLEVCFDSRSPLASALEGLPHSLTEMLFWTPRIPVPEHPAPIYLDPAYF